MVQVIPDKLYVRLFAGMGDFYKRYFCHVTWQCIEDLKLKHPEVSIHALLVSQTIPALNLVDYHPYIDKIIKPKIHLRDFKNKDIKEYVGEHEFLHPGLAKRFECKPPPIYLSDDDKVSVDQITSKYDKYICMHPFAGDAHGFGTRTPLYPTEYIPTIEALIAEGYTVLMLGKTWGRINHGSRITKMIKEQFDWTSNGFVNLINKTNARTAAELIRRSDGFVGTASSLMCAAWSMGGVKTVIITSERWKKPLEEMVWAQGKINQPHNKLIYLNKDRSDAKLKGIADETRSWFK